MKEKNVQFNIRMSENEKKYIQHKADLANKSLSEYCRSALINGIVIQRDTSKVVNVLTELNRIGNNVNQIAKAIHIHGDYVSQDEFTAVRQEFEEMKNIIIEKMFNATYELEARLNDIASKVVDVYVGLEDLYDEEEQQEYMEQLVADFEEFGFEFPNHDEEEQKLSKPKSFEELLNEEFGD